MNTQEAYTEGFVKRASEYGYALNQDLLKQAGKGYENYLAEQQQAEDDYTNNSYRTAGTGIGGIVGGLAALAAKRGRPGMGLTIPFGAAVGAGVGRTYGKYLDHRGPKERVAPAVDELEIRKRIAENKLDADTHQSRGQSLGTLLGLVGGGLTRNPLMAAGGALLGRGLGGMIGRRVDRSADEPSPAQESEPTTKKSKPAKKA